MKEYKILLCADCLEFTLDDNYCEQCTNYLPSYYELTEEQFYELDELDYISKDNYLRDFTINTMAE